MTALPTPPWPPVPDDPDLTAGTVDVVWAELGRDDHRGAMALRGILGRYLGADPGSIAVERDALGKPRLRGSDALRFNLSHSGGVALCAVAVDLEVGVDLEIRERRVDEPRIAERVLGRDVAERLDALPAENREREFLLEWVSHEAAQKCRGAGIFAEKPVADRAAPWVTAWSVGKRAAAALACEREPHDIRRWTWQRR